MKNKLPQTDATERLAKHVAHMVPCSRREAELYIEGGWVQVDGVVVEEPQFRVSQQKIQIDPAASLLELNAITLVLHKPANYTDGVDEDLPAGGKKRIPDARSLLTPAQHWAQDPCTTRVLKRHFNNLEGCVELENGASGLVVFTQDWRTERKLTDEMGTMEHELIVDIAGEVSPEALKRITYALKDTRMDMPHTKVSINSSTPERSKLRFAVKGAHPGLVAYLCEQAQLTLLGMRRTRLGRISLSDLPQGQWRYLAGYERF